MNNPRFELICKIISKSQKVDAFVFVDRGGEKSGPQFGIEWNHEKMDPNSWHAVDESHWRKSGKIQHFLDYESLVAALVETFKYDLPIASPFVSALFEGESREIFGLQDSKSFSLTLDASSFFGALFDDPESAALDYSKNKKIAQINWSDELRILKDPRCWKYKNVWTINRFGESFFHDLGEALRKVNSDKIITRPEDKIASCPSPEAIARAKVRVSLLKNATKNNPAIELNEELKNGGKKRKASQRSAGDNSIGTRGKQNTRRTR